jgi:hypothetical protein
VKRKTALANVGQVVDVIDDRPGTRGKGIALLLKAQRLFANLLQQSRQGAPGCSLSVPEDFQLGSHSLHLSDGARRIAVPGTRLEVDLDHD